MHDGCRRQLESEALARHDALRHYDAHDALRRVDLHLAWGEERAAQDAHGYTMMHWAAHGYTMMHWAVSSGSTSHRAY